MPLDEAGRIMFPLPDQHAGRARIDGRIMRSIDIGDYAGRKRLCRKLRAAA